MLFRSLGVTRSLGGGVVAGLEARLRETRPGDDLLGTALARLRQASGGEVLPPGDAPTDDLPPALSRAMGLLLAAVETTLDWRQRAFEQAPGGSLGGAVLDLRRFALPGDEGPGPQTFVHQRRLDWLAAGLDIRALHAGAVDLCLVFDAVRADLQPVAGFQTRRWDTPLGAVILAGDGDDTHLGDPPLLLVDLGGADTYQGGAAALEDRFPVSIVIDVAGADTYQATSGLGAAIGGVALQIDLAGDDIYEATDVAQGCGIGGVGLLYDAAGDDRYTAGVHAQGAGAYGYGLLIDGAGSDTYVANKRAQGFGYTLGAGLLLDAGTGTDSYTAGPAPDSDAVLSRDPDAVALAQGCGFGRRGDGTDGHSTAGGLGWLVDGGGNDSYTASSLAQGVGYAFGLGFLTDAGGNDTYRGADRRLGVGTQAGIGVVWDGGGADRYIGEDGLGAGLDFGLGWLIDVAGNDRYELGSVGLGGAVANGLGFAWDLAGDDTYDASGGPALGRGETAPRIELLAVSLRRGLPTVGLWLDGGGRNEFPGEIGPVQ